MKLAGLCTIATLAVAAAGAALAQGSGQTTQGGARYSIDGPGGGVPTSRPPATMPVPPATRFILMGGDTRRRSGNRPVYRCGRVNRPACRTSVRS
uniref:Uncharacterized protein n=1 Tax=Rhizobium leguminosarum TaxID=384 RepID=A0A179BSG4_RHILE|nr:hypothetical protein A4U53_39615 [Rhizobium leguminosarum]